MAETELDVELLIALVEERPVLWDKTLDIYKNKNLTAEAWKEICSTLLEKYDVADEETKNEIGRSVQKRWTNLRDAWMKSMKKDTKKTAKGARPKKYVYHDQMIFLKKNSLIEALSNATEEKDSLSPKEESNTEASTSTTEPGANEYQPNSATTKRPSEPMIPTKEPKKRKVEIDTVEEKILQELRKKPEENRHMSFFKSVVPSIDTFSDDQIMDFQMGVLSLIKDIRQNSSNVKHLYTSNPPSPIDIKPSWITSEDTSIDYISGLHTSVSIPEDMKPPKFNDHGSPPSSPATPAVDVAPHAPRHGSKKDDYVCFCCWRALYPQAAVEYLQLHSLHGSHSRSADSSAAGATRGDS